MSFKLKAIKILLSAVMIAIPLQLVSIGSAHAAPGSADLSLSGYNAYLGGVYGVNLCNLGDETVFQLDLDAVGSNYDIERFLLLTGPGSGTDAFDSGSINPSSGVWNGELRMSQCLNIAAIGSVVGEIGENISVVFSVASSQLSGSVANDDLNTGNSTSTVGPSVISALPDMKMTTRLKSTGTITTGSTVVYEVVISNIGQGSAPSTDNISLAFIVPSFASFDSVTDQNTGDALTLPDNGTPLDPSDDCSNYGPPSNGGSGLSVYSGSIVLCMLDPTADLGPNTEFKFDFSMTAASDFASGNVQVLGLIMGQDSESLEVQIALLDGENPFLDAATNNNMVVLAYDPNALTVTVNRCAGQGAFTTNGNGCFNVTFNKLIYAPEFTQSDLVLTGGGTVSGFTQIDDYTWRVNITGIQPGSTLALTLGAQSVLDYSAVQNGVSVLGENTIRYESPLPETGVNSSEWITSFVLMLLGFALLKLSRVKKTEIVGI